MLTHYVCLLFLIPISLALGLLILQRGLLPCTHVRVCVSYARSVRHLVAFPSLKQANMFIWSAGLLESDGSVWVHFLLLCSSLCAWGFVGMFSHMPLLAFSCSAEC